MISPAYIKRILYAIPVFLMMCGMLTTSSAQKFKAEAYTDTNKILIGDQVTLTLILNNQFGKEVLWPEIGDTITSAVEVIDRTDSDTLRRHGDGTWLAANHQTRYARGQYRCVGAGVVCRFDR